MKFFVGIGEYHLDLSQARSLKDKRQVLRRVVDRIGNSKLTGVAEVGDHDYWKSSTLAVTCVSGSHRMAEQALDGARRVIEDGGVEVVEEVRLIISPEDIAG